MDDDELRDRLRRMPEPATTIDVDAVVADARRRRRPKVVGVGAAAVAGCLAFLAPVVVPGLLGPDSVTATLQEQGVGEEAPAAPAPETTDDAGGSGADDPSALDAPEEATTAAPPTGVGSCAVAPVELVEPGLALAFERAPEAGAATLLVENVGDVAIVVRVGDVGVATLDGSTVVAATSVDPGSSLAGFALALEPGDVERIDVDVAADPSPCGDGDATQGVVAPVVALATGASAVVQPPVVGAPTP